MGRKSGVLEFRRPKQRFVAVKRRPSKFRPRGLSSRAHGPQALSPMLRMGMLVTGLGALGVLAMTALSGIGPGILPV